LACPLPGFYADRLIEQDILTRFFFDPLLSVGFGRNHR
jgi:hypothetical protein